MRRILRTRGLEPIRNSEFILRNGFFHGPWAVSLSSASRASVRVGHRTGASKGAPVAEVVSSAGGGGRDSPRRPSRGPVDLPTTRSTGTRRFGAVGGLDGDG